MELLKNPTEIFIQHTGSSASVSSCSSGASTTGDASHTRIILKFTDKTEEVLYTGPEFSEAEHEKKLAERKLQEGKKESQ